MGHVPEIEQRGRSSLRWTKVHISGVQILLNLKLIVERKGSGRLSSLRRVHVPNASQTIAAASALHILNFLFYS